jgi:hypothetical protein
MEEIPISIPTSIIIPTPAQTQILTSVRDLLIRASDKRLKTFSLVGRTGFTACCLVFLLVCGEDTLEPTVTTVGATSLLTELGWE